MGNILSYFFPQPAPVSIEQVVEEVAEDVATIKKATEEPASPAQEDIGVINDPITSDLVFEKEFEVVEDATVVSTEQADEQLEANIQEDLPSVKETSPEPGSIEFTASVKDIKKQSPDTATHEYVSDEASETVSNPVTQEKGIMNTEVEMIGSIQNSDVVEQVISYEDTVSQTSEPMKPSTSELEVVAPTPELPTAPTPAKALTTESIIIPTPESNKAPAPELSIASTPDNAIIPPKADKIPTPEPALIPDPGNAIHPEAVNIPTPEPTNPPTAELPTSSSPEPANAFLSEAIKDPTPEHTKAITPELPTASSPEPVNAIHPEAINIPTPEPTKPQTPELPTASVNAIPPEAIEDTIPESTKAPTPELPEVSSPGPVNIIPPDALNISYPSSAPELPKASTPEPVNAPPEVIKVQECPEPTKAPGPDLLDVDVIGLIEQNKREHDEEELSDGASGLKNLLTGATD
eukprot:GFUD01100407.1.p1 GENE.GFUD01100407.1~~GFUD01100407.1.p1  ORF type:complete len:465 (-),score=148.15 GFUD01100407.1:280-1674(-)